MKKILNFLLKKENLFFIIGLVVGAIIFSKGFYTPINNHQVVIVNKFTGNACYVYYNECREIKRTQHGEKINIYDKIYKFFHKPQPVIPEGFEVEYTPDSTDGYSDMNY